MAPPESRTAFARWVLDTRSPPPPSAWQVEKDRQRVARQQEKLSRPGPTQRQLSLLQRVAGVTREEVDLEIALSQST